MYNELNEKYDNNPFSFRSNRGTTSILQHYHLGLVHISEGTIPVALYLSYIFQ